MASRPKRGKYMPLPPPKIAQRQQQMQEQQKALSSDSSSDEETDEEETTPQTKNTTVEEEGDELDDSSDDEDDSSAASGEEDDEKEDEDDDDEDDDEEAQEEEETDEDAPVIETETQAQAQDPDPEAVDDEEFVLVEGSCIDEEEEHSESELLDEGGEKTGKRKRKEGEESTPKTKRIALVGKKKAEQMKAKQKKKDGGNEEEVEDDFRPPPTPRVPSKNRKDREETPLPEITDPHDFGDIYNKLIDDCQSLEQETGNDENFQNAMSRNIQRGQALFEQLMKGALGPPTGEPGARRPMGGTGDMYLAFLHTKISSNIIRNRAERIGSGTSIFSVDSFLDKLKEEFLDKETNEYDATLAAAKITMETAIGTKSLMPLVAIVGTFDRDAVVVPKPKKVRQPIRKPIPEESQETGQEDATVDNSMALVQQNPGAEKLAQEMNKVLKFKYKEKPEPVNLFEFILDRTSFPKTVENIFYLSFLIKDAHVSLNKEENGKFKDLSLVLKPEKSSKLETSSPDEDQQTRNQTHRQKYILSFSPRMWKQMCQISQGEDTLSNFQKMMESVHQQQQVGQAGSSSSTEGTGTGTGTGRRGQRGLPAIKF